MFSISFIKYVTSIFYVNYFVSKFVLLSWKAYSVGLNFICVPVSSQREKDTPKKVVRKSSNKAVRKILRACQEKRVIKLLIFGGI